MTEQEILEYLESHRKFTIEVDANDLVDTTIKHWHFIRDSFKQLHGKNVTNPEVSFNGNEIEYLEMVLNWDKGEHHLDIEIFDGRSNTYVYYVNQSTGEKESYWYILEEPLPEKLLIQLQLFTEEAQ